ncbi:MAG: hypothetical protein M1837_006814 [Sclerophora amabilis]|nr:MAG: hypothetical protein M1837_006814 [Sclerophora amabilis]
MCIVRLRPAPPVAEDDRDENIPRIAPRIVSFLKDPPAQRPRTAPMIHSYTSRPANTTTTACSSASSLSLRRRRRDHPSGPRIVISRSPPRAALSRSSPSSDDIEYRRTVTEHYGPSPHSSAQSQRSYNRSRSYDRVALHHIDDTRPGASVYRSFESPPCTRSPSPITHIRRRSLSPAAPLSSHPSRHTPYPAASQGMSPVAAEDARMRRRQRSSSSRVRVVVPAQASTGSNWTRRSASVVHDGGGAPAPAGPRTKRPSRERVVILDEWGRTREYRR